METAKKARPGAATPGRAEERNADSLSPASQYSIKGGSVASLLLAGEENALPLRELERLTGLDGRTVRRMIEQERRRGVPILSGRNGYFLPGNGNETRRFVGAMRGRACEILKTASAVERGGGETDQLSFDDLDGEQPDGDDSPERYYRRIAPPGTWWRA